MKGGQRRVEVEGGKENLMSRRRSWCSEWVCLNLLLMEYRHVSSVCGCSSLLSSVSGCALFLTSRCSTD